MGCLCSKTVRCSRCDTRVDEDEFVHGNNICRRCVENLQQRDYARRLAALRDESTTAAASWLSVPAARPSVTSSWSGPSPQTSRPAVTPRRGVTKPEPRYTTRPKTTTKSRRKSPGRPKPLYGEYKCSQCRKSWSSRRSWANMYQKCQRCEKLVYPFLQRELRDSDMSQPERPHPEHLCEKCIRLGSYCGKSRI